MAIPRTIETIYPLAYAQSPAASLGRGAPCDPLDETYDLIDDEFEIYAWIQHPKTILPYVVPWTRATDDLGFSFPSGLVGIVPTIGLDDQHGDPFQDRIDAYLEKRTIAVPATLPSGYTARLRRDPWETIGAGNLGLVGSGGGGLIYLPRMRTATGLNPITYQYGNVWAPWTAGVQHAGLSGNGYVTGSDSTGIYSPYTTWWTQIELTTGLRAAKYTMIASNAPDPFSSVPTFVGTVTVKISHNADGSDPGDAADGDTIDHTHSFSAGDFTQVGFNSYLSSEVTIAGGLLPAVGTIAKYKVSITASHFVIFATDQYYATVGPMNLYGAPRVDIPFPWTYTGAGGLIAPGGTLT
jgi:hypothetical protein